MGGDGAHVEPVATVVLGHRRILLDRLVVTSDAGVQVADVPNGVPILRILLEPSFVLRDRLFDAIRTKVLVGCLLDAIFVQRHGSKRSW